MVYGEKTGQKKKLNIRIQMDMLDEIYIYICV